MSASQDKRKRSVKGSGFGTGGGNKGNDKARITAKAALITVIVVAVLYAASLFIQSSFFRQHFAAVKVDGIKYTVTDFNYYYQNVYAQYRNAMSNAGSMGEAMLPQQDESLKSQVYDEETGETWAEFFRRMAVDQIKEENKIYKSALDAGFQLSDDDKTKLEEDIESLKESGLMYGYTDFGKYLKAIYGKGMTEAEYRKNAERTFIISSYTTHVRDSFQYADSDLETYYTSKKDSFDTFNYRYFLVSAGSFKESDYVDEASMQIAKNAAIAATVLKAEEFVAGVGSEQDFIDAAKVYDPMTYEADSSTERTYQGSLLGSVYGPWMRDAARQTGDVTTVKSSNGTYVVYFISRSDNHYSTVNIRQILVKPEVIDETQYAEETTDDAYNAAVEKANQTAQDSANKIYDEWKQNGATGEQLEQLTTSHASELSAEDSKQYTNVYREQMPEAVSDWLFDPARKAGDYTLIYNEATGYHIIYFEGQDELYSQFLADKDKRDKDLQAWKDALPVVEPKTTWLLTITG